MRLMTILGRMEPPSEPGFYAKLRDAASQFLLAGGQVTLQEWTELTMVERRAIIDAQREVKNLERLQLVNALLDPFTATDAVDDGKARRNLMLEYAAHLGVLEVHGELRSRVEKTSPGNTAQKP